MKLTKKLFVNLLYATSFVFTGIFIITSLMTLITNISVMSVVQEYEIVISIILMFIIGVTGIMGIIYPKNKPYNLFNFLIWELSFYMLEGLACMVSIASLLPTKSNTKEEISQTILYAQVSFWCIIVLFIIASLVNLYLNTNYIKKNNWYVFFILAPNIIFLGLLYQIYINWDHWVNSKNVSIDKILAMFKFYERGNMKIDTSLLNPFLQCVSMYTYILFLVIIMLVGGAFIVKVEKMAVKKSRQKKISKN